MGYRIGVYGVQDRCVYGVQDGCVWGTGQVCVGYRTGVYGVQDRCVYGVQDRCMYGVQDRCVWGTGQAYVWGTGQVCPGFLVEKPNGYRLLGTYLEGIGVDGMIILKLICKKWNGEVWTGLLLFRIGISGRLL